MKTRRLHYKKLGVDRTACGYATGHFRPDTVITFIGDVTCLGCLKLMDEPWHGTPGGYTNHHCRCQACTAANAKRMNSWRERHFGLEPPHHGEYGYNAYGCRCAVCAGDHATRMAAWRETSRKKASS